MIDLTGLVFNGMEIDIQKAGREYRTTVSFSHPDGSHAGIIIIRSPISNLSEGNRIAKESADYIGSKVRFGFNDKDSGQYHLVLDSGFIHGLT